MLSLSRKFTFLILLFLINSSCCWVSKAERDDGLREEGENDLVIAPSFDDSNSEYKGNTSFYSGARETEEEERADVVEEVKNESEVNEVGSTNLPEAVESKRRPSIFTIPSYIPYLIGSADNLLNSEGISSLFDNNFFRPSFGMRAGGLSNNLFEEILKSVDKFSAESEKIQPAVTLTESPSKISVNGCEFKVEWADDVAVKDTRVFVDLGKRQLIVLYKHEVKDGLNVRSKTVTIRQPIKKSCLLNKESIQKGEAAYAMKDDDNQDDENPKGPVVMKVWFLEDKDYVPSEEDSEEGQLSQTQSYEDVESKHTDGSNSERSYRFIRGPGMLIRSSTVWSSSSSIPRPTESKSPESEAEPEVENVNNSVEEKKTSLSPTVITTSDVYNTPDFDVTKSIDGDDIFPLKKTSWKEEL